MRIRTKTRIKKKRRRKERLGGEDEELKEKEGI
jgi:hypothetical protein